MKYEFLVLVYMLVLFEILLIKLTLITSDGTTPHFTRPQNSLSFPPSRSIRVRGYSAPIYVWQNQEGWDLVLCNFLCVLPVVTLILVFALCARLVNNMFGVLGTFGKSIYSLWFGNK